MWGCESRRRVESCLHGGEVIAKDHMAEILTCSLENVMCVPESVRQLGVVAQPT
jgi:hypothetical protein